MNCCTIKGLIPTPLDIKHISDSSATAFGSFLSRYLDFDRAKALIQSTPPGEYSTLQDILVVQALAVLDGDLSTSSLRPLFSSETFHHLDAETSSLLRELIPILATIVIHGDSVLRNLTVAFYTDNSGVPNVLRRSSPVPKIHAIAIACDRQRFDTAFQYTGPLDMGPQRRRDHGSCRHGQSCH